MLTRIFQATVITLGLYSLHILLGVTAMQPSAAEDAVEPAEIIVVLKEALTRR